MHDDAEGGGLLLSPPLTLEELSVQSLKSLLPGGEFEFCGQSKQVLESVAPEVVEYVPLGQSVQDASPVDPLYVPATHCVQVPPSGPEEPALQEQAVMAELPASESE